MRKPRINFADQPGLFDHLENLPVHPSIENAARRMAIEEALATAPPAPLPEPLTFMSLGSGSSGNCAYLGDSTGGFLIDAGVEADKVTDALRRHGISMSKVKGIILTHDHSDHVRFAYPLLRHHRHMALYCTPKALNGLLRRHNVSRRIKDYHRAIYKEFEFELGNFTIVPFEVSHDGTDNAGFFITHKSGVHSFAVATDLGCITERVDHYMRRANYIMIEANYDLDMLMTGHYPEYLKMRIRAERGHLDNTVTARFLSEIAGDGLRNVFLCHLSNDNNTPEKALTAVKDALPAGIAVEALPRFDASTLFLLTPEE